MGSINHQETSLVLEDAEVIGLGQAAMKNAVVLTCAVHRLSEQMAFSRLIAELVLSRIGHDIEKTHSTALKISWEVENEVLADIRRQKRLERRASA